MICAIVTRLMGEKGTLASLTKLMAGLVLAFMLIRPLATIELPEWTDWTFRYEDLASSAVAEGKHQTRFALARLITERTQAYILDKAQALDAVLEVEVTLSDDDIPVPVKVRLSGKVSPYAKGRLQSIITEELGIEKENQIWT